MELLVVGIVAALLIWRILSAGAETALPIPPEIPPENRAAFQLSWLAICFAVIVISVVLLLGVAGAGLGILYEQQGRCDNAVRVPNGVFGDVGECVDMILPSR